ncbi:zinc dependent phospholipase C family protein [Hellea sp.]|nr:zinc dependent phospholipase C family protein [Hellea sp.]
MQSPTHTLLALALLSKKGDKKRNWAVFLGSIIPDAAIYIWAPYQRFVNDESWQKIWRELYFQEAMQNLIAYFNSIPIYGALAVIGYVMRAKTWGKVLLFFALAALTHMATDLPVHNHDAYRHFWPLSDWRFISPFSYYERDHHAGVVSLIEAAIAVISMVVLWRRFPKLWVKIILGLLFAYYVILPIVMHLLGS